ncbi:MAG: outer membrane protein assembly factor BamE [Burkholderiales bacterium]
MMYNKVIYCLVAISHVLLISACSYLTPYKIDIQQGNIVAQESVEKLKTGMSRSEVKNLLGTPLVSDIYHADRWDYVYRLRKGWSLEDQRKLTLFFEKDVLARIEGQGLPDTDVSAKK